MPRTFGADRKLHGQSSLPLACNSADEKQPRQEGFKFGQLSIEQVCGREKGATEQHLGAQSTRTASANVRHQRASLGREIAAPSWPTEQSDQLVCQPASEQVDKQIPENREQIKLDSRMQEPVSAPLASLASAGCRASPNSAQSPGYHSAASSPSCSAAASPVSSSSASSSCSSNSSNARSSASSAASSQQQQANLDKLRAQQTSGRVAPNPSAESPIEQQQQHIKEESGPFKPTPQASQSNKTRQPQPQQQHQAANLSGASLASSLFDLLPELGHDGALLTWSHATNSRASLSAALAGECRLELQEGRAPFLLLFC